MAFKKEEEFDYDFVSLEAGGAVTPNDVDAVYGKGKYRRQQETGRLPWMSDAYYEAMDDDF